MHGQEHEKENLAKELTKTRKELDIENKLLTVLRKDELALNEVIKDISKAVDQEAETSFTLQRNLNSEVSGFDHFCDFFFSLILLLHSWKIC